MTIDSAPGMTPVVLVGGRSRRFGRDKLREPWAGGVLVQRPIGALREVFGRRVMLVGECDASIVALADGVIPDLHAGEGPIGGVISALHGAGGDVFVLAGDLPDVDATLVRAIIRGAADRGEACAVLASGGRVEPCIGIYRRGALALLEASLARGERALHKALPQRAVALVACDPARLRNVNTPDEGASSEHPRLDSNQRPTD